MTVQRVTPTATAILSQDALSARIRLIFVSWAAVHSIFFGTLASSGWNIKRTHRELLQVPRYVNYNNKLDDSALKWS